MKAKKSSAKLKAKYGNPNPRTEINRLVEARNKLDPNDHERRNGCNDLIRELGQVFKTRGIDVGDAIEKALADQPGGVSGNDVNTTTAAETAASDTAKAAPPPPQSRISRADEALCAFLAQLEIDQPVGHELPESCKPHAEMIAALSEQIGRASCRERV